MKKKILIPAVALVLVLCCAVGGTLAWLMDSDSRVNIFTVGNVDIELTETTKDYKMVPGCTIGKDPLVTVKAGSENCYLFVKVEESANFKNFMTYGMADGWDQLTNNMGTAIPGVYYRVVPSYIKDQPFGVLKDNQVTVLSTVTKEKMDAITANPEMAPKLTFTAYAIQQNKSDTQAFTPDEAWKQVSSQQ